MNPPKPFLGVGELHNFLSIYVLHIKLTLTGFSYGFKIYYQFLNFRLKFISSFGHYTKSQNLIFGPKMGMFVLLEWT